MWSFFSLPYRQSMSQRGDLLRFCTVYVCVCGSHTFFWWIFIQYSLLFLLYSGLSSRAFWISVSCILGTCRTLKAVLTNDLVVKFQLSDTQMGHNIPSNSKHIQVTIPSIASFIPAILQVLVLLSTLFFRHTHFYSLPLYLAFVHLFHGFLYDCVYSAMHVSLTDACVRTCWLMSVFWFFVVATNAWQL